MGGISVAGIYRALGRMLRALRAKKKERYLRHVPTGDLLVDRWALAREHGFGEGASVYDSSLIIGDVKVGKKTWIGPFTVLDGAGGIEIGAFCSISSGVQIYSHDSAKWALSGGKAPYDRAAVKIGDCCYIGSQSVIAKGVTIGDHCVIGACSFVNRDVPAYSVTVGAPARVIGRVEIDADEIRLIYDNRTS